MESNKKSQVGTWGEETARKMLEAKQYQILETNWRCFHKEVDIIARKDDVIVFVEVKTRTSKFISPTAAVHKAKQKLLIEAANLYVRKKQLNCDIRFDIVSIVAMNGTIEIEHIEGAFYPSLR